MFNKFSIVLCLILISLLLSGCNTYPSLNPSAQNTTGETKPTVTAPILSNDGNRTTYADIVEKVTPAVVNINCNITVKQETAQPNGLDDLFKGLPGVPQKEDKKPQTVRGMGSGVIVNSDGVIVTNNHVIENATKIQVELNDKRVFDAKVVGTDPMTDLAILKVDGKDLPFMTLGDSDKVRVGDIILAIGNPLGIGQTVTAGIVSAKGRRTDLSAGSYEDFLQIDAPINQGNSGGALVGLNGELIGINSQILSTSGGNIGIGFSIPSNMTKSIMEQLLKDGKVHRGQLGVGIQAINEALAKNLDLKDTKGVIVGSLVEGGAAAKAGIKRGDVIVSINGEKIDDGNSLRNKVAATAPGTVISLTIVRDGKEEEVKATLDEFKPEKEGKQAQDSENAPDDSKSNRNAKLGLSLRPITPDLAKRLQIPADSKGMVVTGVDPDSPAADEGVSEGDIIVEINKKPVESFEEVQKALEAAGDKSSLFLVSRQGQTVFLTIQPKK